MAKREPLLGHSAADLALDREDLVDPADRFDSERRFAKIGQYEELAPAVAPARRLGDRAGSTPGIVEIAKPGIPSRVSAFIDITRTALVRGGVVLADELATESRVCAADHHLMRRGPDQAAWADTVCTSSS
jgi:hypothetical protein